MNPQIDLQNEIEYFQNLLTEKEKMYNYDDIFVDSEDAYVMLWGEDLFQDVGTYARTGASKFVIIAEDLNWVLKIPFWNEDIDYCKREVDLYNKAIELDIEEFFTPVYPVGHYKTKSGNTLLLYLAQKVDTDHDTFWDSLQGIPRSDNDTLSNLYSRDVICEFVLIDKLAIDYSQSALDKLVRFIEEENINDLRSENTGLNKEGKLIFLDYSGYYCEC